MTSGSGCPLVVEPGVQATLLGAAPRLWLRSQRTPLAVRLPHHRSWVRLQKAGLGHVLCGCWEEKHGGFGLSHEGLEPGLKQGCGTALLPRTVYRTASTALPAGQYTGLEEQGEEQGESSVRAQPVR